MATDPAAPSFGLGHARIESESASRIVLSKWEKGRGAMWCCGAFSWRVAFGDPLVAFGDPLGCLRVRIGCAIRRRKTSLIEFHGFWPCLGTPCVPIPIPVKCIDPRIRQAPPPRLENRSRVRIHPREH